MEQAKQLDYINQFPVKVGCYYMQRGGLVRVFNESAPGKFSTEYVQINGDRIICGGSSGGLDASEYKPITDASMVAAAAVREAQIKEREHQESMQAAIRSQSHWMGALVALRAARAAMARATHQGE